MSGCRIRSHRDRHLGHTDRAHEWGREAIRRAEGDDTPHATAALTAAGVETIGGPDRGSRQAATSGPTLPSGTLLVLYGASGFAAMTYQVAWIRALILSMGASTYAFSAIIACFIVSGISS